MKQINIILLLLAAFGSLKADLPKNRTSFKIHEKEYRFSNYFEMNANEMPLGVVVKKRFAFGHITNHYEVYNDRGDWEATGKTRFLSLGTLYSWATEIDIRDARGKYIGMIDGQVATLASARFSIYEYNEAGWKLAGIAFMDNEKRSFSIVDPNNDKRMLATLKRILLVNERDHWECNIFDTSAIDERIVKVFAAFAVDHQEFFRADN